MSSKDKLIALFMSGKSDNNFDFEDLKKILTYYGFSERNNGTDHFVYTHADINEIVNIQPVSNGKAKPYQVKQARKIIKKYWVEGDKCEK